MKRAGGLYDTLWQWDTLRLAFHRARKGAARSPEARRFELRLDDELRSLQGELRAGAVTLRGFTQFTVHDPKERTITAPAFRDRVLHHAIMAVCEPHFDRWLIADTYACRRGKGRLACLERATAFAARHGWFVKADIRKYFESIPHENLIAALHRKFKDPRLLALLERIARAHAASPGRGLPIGSLMSQHFANFYLDPLDRLAKETLRLPGYLRYMDDFALWSDDRAALLGAWREIETFLPARLGLDLKAGTHLNRTSHGMNFCGMRIFPGWRVLNRRSRRRLVARLSTLDRLWETGVENEATLQARAQATFAFAREAKSWHIRSRALARASTA